MSEEKKLNGPRFVSRRGFLMAAAAATGTGLIAVNARAQNADAKSSGPAVLSEDSKAETLNVGIIGMGAQGQALMEAALKIPGIRFKAICDVWEFRRTYGVRYLKAYKHEATGYEDYNEMLDKEDLDAVLVASPDFWHARHAVGAMEKGLHVYCEKEMANNLEDARAIVLGQRKTGKIVQIGHQRRSNPRYKHVVDNLFREGKLLGNINHAYAQWNRSKSDDLGWAKRHEIAPEILEKYGYKNMQEFRNWRWYKAYGGGPIVDLGSHQIDIFNWVFDSEPISVTAVGGADYYKNHEWYDNVYAIFEYNTPHGVGRALYRVLTTTKHGQFYETFMGDEGSLDISEVPNRGNQAWREEHAADWQPFVDKGWLSPLALTAKPANESAVVDVRVTSEAAKYPLPVELDKLPHQPHLENFFDAIRKGTALNCPAEEGFKCAVSVLKVNEAVAAQKKLFFDKSEFVVS